LPGSELRIEKALDQTRLGGFLSGVVRGLEGFQQRVLDSLGDRQALDSLCAPFGGNLCARYTPDFLRVVLEEGPVKLVAKAVDQEVLECHFRRTGRETRFEVACADRSRVGRPQIAQGCPVEFQRIIEEAPPIEDARQARANQHDLVAAGSEIARWQEIALLS